MRRPRVALAAGALAAGAAAGALAAARPVGRRLVRARVERRFNVVHPESSSAAAPVSERARELHASLLVADLHADSLLYGRDLLRRSSVGHVDVPRLIEGNVALQALSACVRVASHLNVERNEDTTDDVLLLAFALGWPARTWRNNLARALHLADRARRFAELSDGRLVVVDSRGGLDAYLDRRRTDPATTAALLTIEGAAALDCDLDNVDRLADAGFAVFGLTHMVDNAFAGSSSGVAKHGLTAIGRELVARLESRGVLVDVAHTSAATIDDVLGIATRPIVATHTGVQAVVPSVRNLSDEHVRAIAESGGVVGIGFWPGACGGTDAASIARSIVHAVDIGGVEHVALGSDFDGAVATPFDAAGMVRLTDALLTAGLDGESVAKVMGENVFRLLREALPG